MVKSNFHERYLAETVFSPLETPLPRIEALCPSFWSLIFEMFIEAGACARSEHNNTQSYAIFKKILHLSSHVKASDRDFRYSAV